MSGDSFKHGDSPGISGYRKGCKCGVCRAAKRDYMRTWRSRKKEAEAVAAGEEPLVDRAAGGEAERPPLESAPALDWHADAGTIEKALIADLAEKAGEVLWLRSYVSMAKMNARILDQVARHERLDLVPSVMLRQNEILNRLSHMKLNGYITDGETGDDQPTSKDAPAEDVDDEARRLLEQLGQ